MTRRSVSIVALGLAVLWVAACERAQEPEKNAVTFTAEELAQIAKLSPLPALPPSRTNAFADNPAAARLGQRLFFDPHLSANAKISCATCHKPEHGFADDQPLSQAIGTTEKHTMPLWNMAYQHWFFWNGRADSPWSQAAQPIQHPAEMGATPDQVRAALASDATVKSEYEALFGALPASAAKDTPDGDRVLANVGKALEAYERRLISTDSPFDRFAAALLGGKPIGKDAPLSESAQRGLKLFVGAGKCVLCHAGPNFSDGEFHNVGLPGLPTDQGRFSGILDVRDDRLNGLGAFSDDRSPEANVKLRFLGVKMNNLGEYKTPTLRSVALTPPYMHDGSLATLRDVLNFYSELPSQPMLGHREETLQARNFSAAEKADLEAFLHSLTGAPIDPALTRPLP
jgi:cytochrome c peroxidase